jgi:hypothetical protein
MLMMTLSAFALPSAEETLNRSLRNPALKGDSTGEGFCWQAAYSMGDFLEGYQATGDTAWLDAGVKYYDFLLDRMAVGPDGYKGWIGPFVYNNKYWCDVHVGDALLFEHMLEFGATVHKDPKLEEKYGDKVKEYVASAEKNLFEKWEKRGTWHEDGPVGFYVAWDKYGMPGELKDWKVVDEVAKNSGLTLPFNKQNHLGMCAIYLWQITGDSQWKTHAEKIFGYTKSRIQNYKGAYHWNYWEPAGQWDIDAVKTEPRHWVGVHPYRNYQAGEVSEIVKAYNAGIVFTEDDIKAIINTNLKVMWNGDEENPKFANSNKDYHPKAAATPARDKEGVAGTLWTSLAQFDPTIRKLTQQQLDKGKDEFAKAHFEKTIANTPTDFTRRDVEGDVQIPEEYKPFPMGDVKGLYLAAALPSTVTAGGKSVLICKLVDPAELDVTIQSGEKVVATLYHGPAKEFHLVDFTGKTEKGDPIPPGNYRVRWTIKDDGFREYPIAIK